MLIKRFNEYRIGNGFWEWFNDSKIVDDNGNPLVCYHGSDVSDIKEFSIKYISKNTGNEGHYGYGIYFSTDVREAKTYGKYIYKCYIKISNPFTGTEEQIMELKREGVSGIDDIEDLYIDYESFKKSLKKIPNAYEFLNDSEEFGLERAFLIARDKGADLDLLQEISDILEYTDKYGNGRGIPYWVTNLLEKLNISPKIITGFMYPQSLHWITDLGNHSREVTDIIKKLNYDGIWIGSEIVAFDPKQIRII